MSPKAVVEQDDPKRCSLAWAAKVVCSAVFIAGRDPERAFRESAAWMLLDRERLRHALATGDAAGIRLDVSIEVDPQRKAVTLVQDGRSRACARIVGDQGAVVVADPDAPVHFRPVAITPRVPDPATTPWPIGDCDAFSEGPVASRDAAMRAADLVFENPAQLATAFLVVHRGRLVVERYAESVGPETRLEGWSMGKTIAALLAGRAIALGMSGLDSDGLFPEWRAMDDPRSKIRLRDLLQLSSGLEFSGAYGADEDLSLREIDGRFLDHIYVYAGGIDSSAFCSAKPSEHPPGRVGRYRNCDPLLVVRAVRDFVAGRGEEFLSWPQRELFDPLGIRGIVLETDPYGNFLITGHDHGRARDWARLGLLLLEDGVSAGRRLLPEGHVGFLCSPAPAWPGGSRGACVVRNASRTLPLPEDAYWMSGAGVNKVIVVPSLDLVVVRLGHIAGRIAGEAQALEAALVELSAAFAASAA
ncbi:hypothetical protein MYXO_03271 [Myxococcaceae bacterium]|nr:hypothetical protein MYXO_03271 [Myxococcaceae bacterium]